MAAFFIDLDGTCLEFHTNKWLPGIINKLEEIVKNGHQLFFITMRGEQDRDTSCSIENTKKLFSELNFEYVLLIQSPRILIDDSQIASFRTSRNPADWLDKF